ncbi:LOW QUALITY PROTEIN: putative pectinesterase/pectinesterase inhibitor 28 [Phalaenopsis equestris]|uniref:LOW QUALITY PROTEIN: putative pectinesterase/pectinesterase inhibitor 28 n=1 Tax=Phalaenopsis equestris TaxID=78828 RepID=UPI0009E3519E|nr:LOW QUALITY PROTEIN: putative pectinesterase/pectinesterase inhibitor 28 [Phalaenopsis equestris]
MAVGKKGTIIGGSVILLIAVVATVVVVVTHNGFASKSAAPGGRNGDTLQSTSRSVQAICEPTDYREICESALSKVANDSTDLRQLIKLSFKVATDHLRQAFQQSKLLSTAARDPRTKDALKTCRELMEYAIEDIKTTFNKFDSFNTSNPAKAVDELKLWLDSAATYQETCLDGFENTTGDTAAGMRKALNYSMALTDNALAIVGQLAEFVDDLRLPDVFSRRLLSEEEVKENEFPGWVSADRRRLLSIPPSGIKPDVVVALDGSGDFSSINSALGVAPIKSQKPFVIYVKNGVYKEKVTVYRNRTNIVVVGDGATQTVVTGSLNFIDGVGTFKTASFVVMGEGFMARDIGFQNTAGPAKHQAVALLVQADRSVFYRCRMDAYQDTLYVHTLRQFYRECTISGTIDFIFGDAKAIFQNCQILVRKPLDNQQNIVTAQGRKSRQSATAIILHNCTITADPSFPPALLLHSKNPTYLGRPWKAFSRTFVIQSFIDTLVNPNGWLPWLGDFGLRTCFYTEVENRGPGADKSRRVKWKGVKNISYAHAQKFTVEYFLWGNDWLPLTQVPYIPALLPQSEPGRIR